MVEFNIVLDDHGLANAFQRKANETTSQFNMLTRDLVNIAQRWVQKEAPRKTGNLKSSVKKTVTGNTGLIWVSKSQAKYADAVIEGHGPIKARKGKALRFVVNGQVIFRRSVGPAKANPFVDRAATTMKGEINQRVAMFQRWLEDI